MAGDMEEFLRRAAERRRRQAEQKPAPPAPQPRRQPEIRYVEPQADAVVLPGEDVAEHVARHMDTSDYADRASLMAAEVGMADDHMEAHVHQVFDHDLGQLEAKDRDRETQGAHQRPSPPATGDIAASLIQMLRTPATVRQAIVLREILDRPEF